MAERKLKGIVRYDNVDSEYLQRRQLRRGSNWLLLWGLGVGAVISGMYSGWNPGIDFGGFWGMAIATGLMGLMYLFMTFSFSEMSAALPHAGGFYAFTRSTFGPFGGFICGAAELFEYILISAAGIYYTANLINGYLPIVPQWVWWIVISVAFAFLNMCGTEIALKVGLALTIPSVALLLIYAAGALISGKFSFDLLITVAADPGASSVLPKGLNGILLALPYAIWWYLAIETIPLASEEAQDTVRDVPKASIWSIYLLLALAGLILFLNSGIPYTADGLQGAAAIAKAEQPLVEGIKVIFGEGPLAQTLIFASLIGNVAGFPAIIFAYSRVFFSLSRAGYLPRWISVTNDNRVPDRAAVFGTVLSFLSTVVFALFAQNKQIGLAMITTSVACAVITYILVMASYIFLKLNRSSLPRPYVSPVGAAGAFVGIVLATIAFIACFAEPTYRISVFFAIGLLVLAAIYFLLYSRDRLVAQAPEEELFLAEESN